jgi:hypothetical protein
VKTLAVFAASAIAAAALTALAVLGLARAGWLPAHSHPGPSSRVQRL